MVRCENCLIFLENDDLLLRTFTDHETCFQGVKRVCPRCKLDDLVDAKGCPRCKKNHVGDDALCENCVAELKNELENFLKNYSVEEQEAMFS